MLATYRGSRKHVLDWVSQPTFVTELLWLLRGIEFRINRDSIWRPLGYKEPGEATLEAFGPAWNGLMHDVWTDLSKWWLAHPVNANTPNWDIIMGCEYKDRPSLILVEAKAHETELDPVGKGGPIAKSPRSVENHKQIKDAITSARAGYEASGLNVQIDRDTHYQLSNRLAFLWKLAQANIPTVLVYLGFTGDRVFSPGIVPFRDDDHWQRTFAAYSESVMPASMINTCIKVGPSPAWLLVKSRPVLELSESGP